MEEIVHLHKDYDTTFCGEDASHIPMTYSVEEATCEKCKEALAKTHEALRTELAEHSENHTSLETNQSEIAKDIENLGVDIHKADLEHREKMEALYQAQHKLIAQHQELSTTVGMSASKKSQLESALQGLPA